MNNNFIIGVNNTFEFKPFPFDVGCGLAISDACFVGCAFNGLKLVFAFESNSLSLS